MEPKLDDVKVENDEAESGFVAHVDGHTAFINYIREKDRIALIHTEVPPELAGRGLAGKLARAALEYAREHHLRVVPICPFVAAYLRRHPEYQDLIQSQDK